MSEPSFPQFRRLPFELRDAVWAEYALPRGPMLHSLSIRWEEPCADYIVSSFPTSCIEPSDYSKIDLLLLPTTRALMQVNREARKAVLAGRQHPRVDNNIGIIRYETQVFLGGIYQPRSSHRSGILLHKIFFVNWDIDMFYYGRDSWLELPIVDSSC
ncbi:hypothetical protein F4678DRAFT_448095 [Xylaria arbuscula]|nr:hypothetical protein F4678DRAFT_448095 [Xylaria arbuscula]